MRLLKVERLLDLTRSVINLANMGRNDDEPILSGFREKLQRTLVELREECETLEFHVAAKQIETGVELLSLPPMRGETGTMARMTNMVCTTIQTETSLRLFFTVPPERAKFYKATALFGDSVESAFPSASNEIAEAGKCMALGRYSASVYHLMRVLEAGLKCLAADMNVPFEHTTWNTVLDQIEKNVRAMNSVTHGADWKEKEQNYSEATASFRIFKNAWRNYAMHLKDTYDEERALDIYNSVRALMRHLSKTLHE